VAVPRYARTRECRGEPVPPIPARPSSRASARFGSTGVALGRANRERIGVISGRPRWPTIRSQSTRRYQQPDAEEKVGPVDA